jgi:hypothetical protein
MRYTDSVSNAFVQSMAHNFEEALRLMEAALTDCADAARLPGSSRTARCYRSPTT